MRVLESGVLTLCGIAIGATGVVGLTDPQALFTPLGVELAGIDAHNEIRAAYGGMHLGIAALLLWGALRSSFRAPALWVGFAFLGGLTAGRLLSLGADGPPGTFVYGLWIPEFIGAAACAVLLYRRQRTDGWESTRTS